MYTKILVMSYILQWNVFKGNSRRNKYTVLFGREVHTFRFRCVDGQSIKKAPSAQEIQLTLHLYSKCVGFVMSEIQYGIICI